MANLIVSAKIERTARAAFSPALEGDAAHLCTDALASLAVLIGLEPQDRVGQLQRASAS